MKQAPTLITVGDEYSDKIKTIYLNGLEIQESFVLIDVLNNFGVYFGDNTDNETYYENWQLAVGTFTFDWNDN